MCVCTVYSVLSGFCEQKHMLITRWGFEPTTIAILEQFRHITNWTTGITRLLEAFEFYVLAAGTANDLI